MIIFGWGFQTSKDYGPIEVINCPNCNNLGWWNLVTLKKWFTLFFIPIIPYDFDNLLMCQVCNRGFLLSNDEIARAKIISKLMNEYFKKNITWEEFLKKRLELPNTFIQDSSTQVGSINHANYEYVQCEYCGENILNNITYCKHCGKKIGSSS